MSAVSLTSALTGSASPAAAGTDPYASMTSGNFIKVLLSELKHQDPTSPTDTTKIMEQLSSLRNIESQMSLQQNLTDLVNQNQVAQASGLIGKLVQGLDANNNRISGNVTSVRVVHGKAMLELDTGQTLSMNNLTMIAAKQ